MENEANTQSYARPFERTGDVFKSSVRLARGLHVYLPNTGKNFLTFRYPIDLSSQCRLQVRKLFTL